MDRTKGEMVGVEKKAKVFLDASVISGLDQRDEPEEMRDTWELWKLLRKGKYEVCISDGVVRELWKCYRGKFDLLTSYLEEIPYDMTTTDDRTDELAAEIIRHGILTQKNCADCKHIANAILSGCDIFVSWNFRDIATYKVARGIRAITLLEGFQVLDICLPSMLLGEDSDGT